MSIVPNNVNVNSFVSGYTTFDEPIPCKGLNIYPIIMKDVFSFLSSYNILTIKKNEIPDIKIIQMSYLRFVFDLMISDELWQDKFLMIVSLCFKLNENNKYYTKEHEKNKLLVRNDGDVLICMFNGWNVRFIIKNDKTKLYIDDVEINSKEFEEICRIIMYQNIVEYDDSYIDPDVQEVIDDVSKLKNKSYTMPTIEKQMSVVSMQTGILKKDIAQMSYREFTLLFKAVVESIDYQINKRVDLQDKKFDKTVPHWVYEQNNDKLDGVFVDKSGFDTKMQNVT